VTAFEQNSVSSKKKTCPVITCYPTDLRVHKLGGIETAISGYFAQVGKRYPLKLVGVDAVGNLKLQTWNRVSWNGIRFDFFPLFVEKNLNRRTFPPLNLRFVFHLWKNKQKILLHPAVLNLRRPDHLIPFWADRRFPAVLTIHGASEYLQLPNESRIAKIKSLYLFMERISLQRADRIFCVSDDGVRYYRKLLGNRQSKVALIENWVDFDLFSPQNPVRCRQLFGLPPEKKVLLFVGRLEKVKDPDLLLQTFREIKIRRPGVVLALAGDGSEKEDMLFRHSDLKPDLHFLGTVPHARLPELFSASDCLLLTSHFEGMPRAVLEALAVGVPVVSTAVGDVPKVVIDGQSGYVVKNRRPEKLAEQVLTLLESRPSLGSCRAAVAGFEASAVLEKIERINQETARRHYGLSC
jgi:glycosyltransferase involved in cell wall biosynthesis